MVEQLTQIRKSIFLLTPIYVLTLVWSLTFLLFFLNPFQFSPLKPYTWFVLLTSLSLIYIGFFTSKLLSQGFRFVIAEKLSQRNDFPFLILELKPILFILTVISFAGIIGKNVLIFKAIGGIDELIKNPAFTRHFIIGVEQGDIAINVFAYKIFSYMGSLVFICTLLGGLLYTIPKSKIVSIFPLFVSFIAAVFSLQRAAFIQNYLYWLISAFIFIYYQPVANQKKAINTILRQLLYFVIIFLIFSLFILVLRFLFAKPEKFLLIFNSFYLYIVGNIVLLDKYLVFEHQPLYGLSIFRSIVSWFATFGLAEKSSILPTHYEFYPIYNTIGNTFSFIRPLYDDFKLPGLLLISYLWGLFSFISINAYLRKFTFVRLGIASIFIYSLLWSFYGFAFIHITSTIWRLFLLLLLDLYMKEYSLKTKLLKYG